MTSCDTSTRRRQVTGIRSTQRGVRKALARTVSGDEVLEPEALTVVRLDRARDDVALGVGHQARVRGGLTHLLPVATSSEETIQVTTLVASKFSRISVAISSVTVDHKSTGSRRRPRPRYGR